MFGSFPIIFVQEKLSQQICVPRKIDFIADKWIACKNSFRFYFDGRLLMSNEKLSNKSRKMGNRVQIENMQTQNFV